MFFFSFFSFFLLLLAWVHYAGTIAPINSNKYPDVYARIPWISQWLDLDVMVPLIALVIVVAVGILVICVAFTRRRGPESRTGTSKDVYCRFLIKQNINVLKNAAVKFFKNFSLILYYLNLSLY